MIAASVVVYTGLIRVDTVVNAKVVAWDKAVITMVSGHSIKFEIN
jgi:hypothetical protein